MKFVLDDNSTGHAIQRYAQGEITIDGKVYRKSLVLTPDSIIPTWRPSTFQDLQKEDFTIVAELKPEIVILGTGAKQHFPSHAVTQLLIDARIGLEVMDTAAACRTYNILMSEGRRVAAALMMIEV